MTSPTDIAALRAAFGWADVKTVWLSVPSLLDEVEALREALEKIAGGYVSEAIPDEDWHGLAAALQDIAHAALGRRTP